MTESNKTKLKGELSVMGSEETVAKYRKLEQEAAAANQELKQLKNQFRVMAAEQIRMATEQGGADVGRVLFMDASGEYLAVSKPNYESPGNRLLVKDAQMVEAGRVGLSFETETTHTYVLKGPWAEWMDNYLAGCKENGQTVDTKGITLKVERKPTVAGLQQLESARYDSAGGQERQAVAAMILGAVRKAFSVR